MTWINDSRFKEYSAFLGAILLVVGLFISRALISIGTVVLALSFLFALLHKDRKDLLHGPLVVFLALSIFLSLSFFYTETENISAFWRELGQRITSLACFAGILSLQKKGHKEAIAGVFILMSTLIGIGTLLNYFVHFEEINQAIQESKPIPIISGHGHISYSVLLAMGLLLSIFGFLEAKGRRKWMLLSFAIVQFILLHSIAARTGLLAFYGASIVSFSIYGWKRKPVLTISILVLGAVLLVSAVQFVTPLKKRFDNTMEDLGRFKDGSDPNYWSAYTRIEALENGWLLARENLLFGVGMADLEDEIHRSYERNGTRLYPMNRINPHNQFLNYLIAGGIPALLLLLVFLLVLVKASLKQKDLLLFSIVLLFFIAFQAEALLERQIGAASFGFAMGYLLIRKKAEQIGQGNLV